MTTGVNNATAALKAAMPGIDTSDERTDRLAWLSAVAGCLLIFGLLENPYWVPGGDSELYVSIARNLATGEGYLFNGQPVRICPPGWPLILAAVMKIWPSFLVMKLITLGCMTGALAVSYRIVRRYAPPKLSVVVILLTALLSHVYSLTFWLHSDALFCLISASAVLLSLQFSEGRRSTARAASIVLLGVCGVMVRFAGMLNIVLICAALLDGARPWRAGRSLLLCLAVAGAVTAAFFTTRIAMKRFATPRVAYEDSLVVPDATAMISDAAAGDTAFESKDVSLLSGGIGATGTGRRILGYGTWFSYLLWQPFRLAPGWPALFYVATFFGWIVFAVLAACALVELRASRWLLPAALLYTIILCLRWPHATARYLVPVAPIIMLMIFLGTDALRNAARKPWQRRTVSGVAGVGVACIILCNASLWAVEVSVMRSDRFYDRYEAGLNKNLMAIGAYLRAHDVGNWQVAVNPSYKNLDKHRWSPTGLRILTMITGKATLSLPQDYKDKKLPKDREFREWLKKNQIEYYLEQPPVSPWRVWHFRAGWLQGYKTGKPVIDQGAGWKLYRCHGRGVPTPLDVTEYQVPLTRVPGF
ncbi:MAG: ArnT family glycosyltransferase [Tepidisphaeraceae bacterium]